VYSLARLMYSAASGPMGLARGGYDPEIAFLFFSGAMR